MGPGYQEVWAASLYDRSSMVLYGLVVFSMFLDSLQKGPCVPTAAEPRKMISFGFLCVSGARNGQ